MTESLRRILGLVVYYLTVIVRNKGRLVDILVWPVLELTMFGFLSRYIQSETGGLSRAAVIILGGFIFWHFFGRTMTEIVNQFTDDAYSGNLHNILVSPVKIWEFIAGMTAAGIIKLSANLAIVLPLSWLMYSFNLFSLGPAAGVYVLILTLWGVSLGLMTASSHFILGTRAGAVSWAIAGIIQPFSLVFYPRAVLPDIAQKISLAIPASYVFEAVRKQLNYQLIDWNGVGLAAALTIIYLAAGIGLFYGSFQLSRRSGMIAKL